MSIFDKFIKRVIIVIDKNTWFVVEWKTTLLNRLNIVDWDLLKTIISNKNFQFFSNFWKTVFKKLNVLLLYFIAYHFQTNDQSKRINQTMKITLRFLMITMNDFTQWSKMLWKIQRYINNVNSITIDKNSNEIFYDFTSIQVFDLWKFFEDEQVNESSSKFNFFIVVRVRVKIIDFIVFAQMKIKRHYDNKHTSIYMRENDYVFIKFHHDYDISFTTVLESKYNQQYVKFFRILKRIDKLTYRFDLFNHWRIHFVLFIVQLKSCFDLTTNLFNRSRLNHSNSVFVKKNIERVKSYEIERLINKRQTKRRESKYLIRWRDYDSKHDDWKNLSKLKNAERLVQKYENVHRKTITLFDRLKITFQANQQKSTRRHKSTSSRKFFIKIRKTIAATDSIFRKTIAISSSSFSSFFVVSSLSFSVMSFFESSNNRFFVVIISKKTIIESFAFNTSLIVVVDDTSSFVFFAELMSRRFVRLLKKS